MKENVNFDVVESKLKTKLLNQLMLYNNFIIFEIMNRILRKTFIFSKLMILLFDIECGWVEKI